MSQFAVRRPSGCFAKVLHWNRGRIRWKRTRSKKKASPSQDVQDPYADITESEIYCPFMNKNKTTNQEALSSLLVSPLSIHYSSKTLKNEQRIYLKKFTSVTSILSQTKPPSEFFALTNWRKAQISELGEEQFKEKKKTISRRGTQFHHEVQGYFKNNKTLSMEEASLYSGYWKSIGHVLRDITNVVAVESGVIHPLLGYAGTLDLIAKYKGLLAVIDWKTSAKHKTNLKDCYSYPQQIAAYAGAVNYDKSYPFQVCDGVIIIAYENGDPADVHYLPKEMCETYWLEWLIRLQQYRKRFPELVIDSTYLEQNLTIDSKPVAKSLGGQSLTNIGTPVTKIGRIVKDEDVIEKGELSPKIEQPASQEVFSNSGSWSLRAWKTALKRVIQSLFPQR
ncbi:mitochondrial genome maintenance exonuclease 1-like [Montipora foliosa]|uniref:mitochondrial genome maintenance exonuclease 1-like n=1 Tax=Montipora foliosa TaxID=591990 RepID=UPI0035F1BC3E